jgi:Protein of unknown function (DUF1592)/Protein of unknown function (DUF1588)/Protein of unknown function (DUF1595)/Protein of unknown function (DUF1585)/Protein of unknown function (DUF1587)
MNTFHLGAILLVTIVGCTGYVGEPSERSARAGGHGANGANGPSGGGTGAGLPSTGDCQEEVPLVTAARRLTRTQYANILRDLRLDAKGTAAEQLPVDDAGDEVAPDPRSMIVTSDWAASAMSAAEMAAKMAVADLSTLLPCDPASGEEACARQFIGAFGQRAYRRPLETTEVDSLMKVYGVGAKGGGFTHGIEVALRAVLQSPSFLYVLELGQPEGSSEEAVHLTPYEVASRLSFLFWNTTPDDALLAAAADDKLSTRDDIAVQARRLLADPKAEDPLAQFHGKWLGIDGLASVNKDPAKYAAFDDKLAASMRTELDLYVKDVLFQGDGRLESLFESHFTYVDALVAPLYGIEPPAGGGFARVDLDPKERAGILTNVGIITSHTMADASQAIHRGKFVRERLLCSPLQDPPPTLMVTPPEPKPGVSTRERLKEHSNNPACEGCHKMMEPIGFGFEAYDGLGQHQMTDPNGQPVDDSGTLDMTDVDGPFHGPVELGQKLAKSAQVRECVASTLVRYARGPEADDDACVRQKLVTAFDAKNHDIKELIVAITQTDGFSYRHVIEGEQLP